jgi:adenylate cyclase
MTAEPGMQTARDLIDWLVASGLDCADEQALFDGLCERLNAAGFGLLRGYLASEVLHPLHEAKGIVWQRDGVSREDYQAATTPERRADYENSPLYQIIEEGVPRLRMRLDGSLAPGRFPLLHRLRDAGGTDYFALSHPFRAGWGDSLGIVATWTTMQADGFTPAQLVLIEACMPPLALAFKAIAGLETGRTLMRTYLGHDAGARVIQGEIRRGEPQAIDAVLWFSDLRGFTRLADSIEPGLLMGLLNGYAERLVSAIEAHGGDVLKFMGDGILALFRADQEPDPCARALAAAMAGRTAVEALSAERAAAGLPVTDFYLGLHRGTVLYGNIGSTERLDFTVIGPAVNEVARIEQMCRSLDQPVVVSSAFAEACGADREKLVALGRYALRGVGRAQALYTIDPESLAGRP